MTNEEVYREYLSFGKLVKGGRVAASWLLDGSSFWYVKGACQEREIIKVDPVANHAEPLFNAPWLQTALRDLLGCEPPARGMPFDECHSLGGDRIGLSLHGERFELNLSRDELIRSQSPSSEGYADLVVSEAEREVTGTFTRWKFYASGRRETSPEAKSPDDRWILTIRDHNVVLRASVDGQPVQLTGDGAELAFWDIDPALWNPWAPDGSRFVAVKQHTQGLRRIPTIEWLKPREQTREIIALPAGGPLYRSELYLFDIYSQQPISVALGATTDQYVRILSWSPDGSELMIARYNRVMSQVDLQAVNARTGSVRTLLTETSATFVAHHCEVLWGNDTGFALLPDGCGFIWGSERSGWKHFYHYDITGRLIRALTAGSWRVKEVLRVDCGWVYFTGHGDEQRPYDTHLYRVRLDGGGLSQLTQGRGQHTVFVSPSGKYFIDTYSAVDVPPTTVLRAVDGTLIRTLEEADISRLQAIGWVPSREYVVKAADGVTDLWATVHFPHHWDPKQKYPVVEYIYGGPQSIVRPLDFGDQPKNPAFVLEENFNRSLAQLGFLVVTVDARGTPGRSKAFQDVVCGRFGQFEIADHAAALRQLGERLPSMDLDRVGVWGWSWGGQFAFRALTQAPELYKVGVCGWPALDLQRMMLYEAYLGMPQENMALYRAADTFALAPKLKGSLVLIGGMNDPSTQADLFKLSEILIRLGKQHVAMSYPNCGHGAVGKTAEYDIELKKTFFLQHLMTRPTGGSEILASTAEPTATPCTR